MKLISDIKQYLILNDFPSVNEAIAANSKMFLGLQTSADCRYVFDKSLTGLFGKFGTYAFR